MKKKQSKSTPIIQTAQLSLDFSSRAVRTFQRAEIVRSGEILPPITSIGAAVPSTQTGNLRIWERHEKLTDNAITQFRLALLSAVMIILAKIGVPLTEATIIFVKLAIPKSIVVACLGLITIWFACVGAFYWTTARILQREFPEDLTIRLTNTRYDVILVNIFRYLIIGIAGFLILVAVYFSIADIFNFFYSIMYYLKPPPWETEITRFRK